MPNNPNKQSRPNVCFVIAPIGEEGSDTRRHSDQVLKHLIKPAAEECGYEKVVRADQISMPGMMTPQIIQHLVEAPLVIADLTDHNPNVFYELALRHAIKKPVVQLMKEGDPLPFDVFQMRTVPFDLRDPDKLEESRRNLVQQIRAVESNPLGVDNPISTAIDLQALRQSEDPVGRGYAEILSILQELRTTLERLRPGPRAGIDLRETLLDALRVYESQQATSPGQEPSMWQPLLCVATAEPRVVRAEGLAELLDDITLSFTGGGAHIGGGFAQKFNIRLVLNTNITSSRQAGRFTEARLLSDDGLSMAGTLEHHNVILFANVPVEGPGTKKQNLRITNLRLSVAALGAPDRALESGRFPDTNVVAAISITGDWPPALITPTVIMGYPRLALSLRLLGQHEEERPPFRFRDRAERNERLTVDPTANDAVISFCVEFKEYFQNAFKTGAQEAGTADGLSATVHGTRMLLKFFNVPEHVHVFVTTTDVNPSDGAHNGRRHPVKAVLATGSDANGCGGGLLTGVSPNTATADGLPIMRIAVREGFGFAVWEWVNEARNPQTPMEHVRFGVVLGVESGHEPLGALSVSGNLAPLSTVGTSSDTEAVPRFVEVQSPRTVFLFGG